MNLLGPLWPRPLAHEGPALAEMSSWGWIHIELADAWRAAQDEATWAYDYWRETADRLGFAVYRAAQDRADMAQDELAGHWLTAYPQ